MKACCVVLTALLLAASAQARLGETEAQIAARLGPPWSRTGDSLFNSDFTCYYRVPGFSISVHFINGFSHNELYSVNGRQIDPGSLRPLTTQEAESILFANGGRSAWTRLPQSDNRHFFEYQRRDGTTGAIGRDGTHVLIDRP